MPRDRSKQKARNRRYKKRVHSFPRQIQSSTYVQPSRLVRFSDTRSFIVEDNGIVEVVGADKAVVPALQISANAPTDAFTAISTGTWWPSDMGAKGVAVHGLAQWITKADGTNGLESISAAYRTAQCLSSKIVVSAYPLPSADGADALQDCAKLVLQKSTAASAMQSKQISQTFNVATTAEMPFLKGALTYRNPGGTPRGCTLSGSYSYKRMNSGPASMSKNLFSYDQTPAERDYWNIALLPADSQAYASVDSNGDTTATRMCKHRIEIKLDYIVALSEPQTNVVRSNVGDDLGGGPSLPSARTVAEAFQAGAAAFAATGF